ncbi:hypothetical protein SAMN04489712_11375 [Thermomonospora echinospora]|uniref:DUF4350 domain-containing protein n=1 Tax=Thermomonospora echinospora TaxID=1992 RepID=A0A1H6D570_9ACTN|nr:DUF6421 family protein [Thermomonospora echinospora]SEG80401.1 hypothetical protein SAMN04489712_11375 [Thermomonospora echinospora]
MRGFARVVFDEAHRESWSIREQVVARMNPGHPADSGYLRAAGLLRRHGHEVIAHADGPLNAAALAGCDVLVIAHPAEDRWERTTGTGSPLLSAAELDAIENFVRTGGGLVVLAECEQDKYGNNLGELLGRFGIGVASAMVTDPSAAHRDVAAWVMAEPVRDPDAPEDLLAGVRAACFYRAGVLTVDDGGADDRARVLLRTSPTADPAGAPLAVAVRAGAGRVVAFADSDLFGDDSIEEHDQAVLWTNVVTWAAGEPAGAASGHGSPAAAHPAWAALKEAVEELRPLQSADGSVETGHRPAALALVERIAAGVAELAPLFPHDADYLEAVRADLRRWADGGLGVPDFLDSLNAFQPQLRREDGLEHLVVFPMYTQNGNPARNVEAVLLRVVWPDWLAELERSRYDNPMFVPVAFTDFTSGYDTNSAVLFPETVAVRQVPPRFTWGAIFCDREAARFRRVSRAAADTLRLSLPPQAARLIADQDLAQDTFVMWDLVHDRTHSRGDLPFDPFMIKQRMPYWLYALEELRCDLTTYRECVRLEPEGIPHARLVCHAILFDRLFRFPITGERVRNYDGLGGQLLFSYLHKNDVIRWTDNRLSLQWDRVDAAVVDLCEMIEKLYRDSIDRPKLAHWLAAYELVSRYVEPHPGSVWARGVDALPVGEPPKAWTDAVLPDEFPLSMFYEALRKKLADVIASTKGIRG